MALPEFNHLICMCRQRLRRELSPSVGTAPSQDERRFRLVALCPERKYESPLRGRCASSSSRSCFGAGDLNLAAGWTVRAQAPGVRTKEPAVKWLVMEEFDALWAEALASASLWRVAPWGSARPDNDGKLPRAPQRRMGSLMRSGFYVCAVERSPWVQRGSAWRGAGKAHMRYLY